MQSPPAAEQLCFAPCLLPPAGMLALHSHNPVVLHRDLKGWVLEAGMQGQHVLMRLVAAMSTTRQSQRQPTHLPES